MFGQTILLIGYGGVAEALAAVALEAGAAKLLITGRNRDKAERFANNIRDKGWNKGNTTEISALSEEALETALDGAVYAIDSVLQATSAGMWPKIGDLPLSEAVLRKLFSYCRPFVFDAIYNPAVTRIMLLAKSAGLKTMNGLPLLFYQGLEARKIWQTALNFTAADLAETRICASLAATLRDKYPLKLLLTGFMGAGKSRLGLALKEQLGAAIDFVDLDSEIVRRQGRSIPEIFEQEGEAAFRAIEAALLGEILAGERAGQTLLLATGGGTVVQEGAAARIHAAGAQVILLDVSLETALERIGMGGQGRPMVTNADRESFAHSTEALYNQRSTLYEQAADLIIDAELPLDVKTKQILAGLAWL